MDYGSILVTVPTSAPLPMTAAYMDQIHTTIPKVYGAVYVPSLLKAIVQNPSYLSNLKKAGIHSICFGGAPLDQETGDICSEFATVVPMIGATETGSYGMRVTKERMDWMYYDFDPESGLRFLPFQDGQDGLYESIFIKFNEPEKAKTQLVFQVFPDLDTFHTKDVWHEHPTKKGLWSFAGRTDDFVKLSTLTKFNATHIEGVVLKDSRVKAAIMGGDRKPVPFLLLELVEGVDEESTMEAIWLLVKEINAKMSKDIKLEREMILCTGKGKYQDQEIPEKRAVFLLFLAH